MANRETLSDDQLAFYKAQGYLVLEKRIPDRILADIRSEITRFKEEASGLTESNDRLDLEDSHSPENPRVRRIKLPHTISEVIKSLMYSDHILAPVRDLIGPNLRIHTTKLNM
ncbi:MAG: phytanoyl-CoA dioxygenase family protein, partial [Alphaproteobacteria bacterium]|nr:phytanoyl-CoA dioxygenase family protein [Alphaproteobacteria bacterium]